MINVQVSGRLAPTQFRPPRDELFIVGLTFFVFSTIFGITFFQNFAAPLVVALQFTLAAVPGWLFLRKPPNSVPMATSLTFFSTARAVLGGLGLATLQAVSLVASPDYFGNFAYLRLEVDGEYHADSAFHVAIIQSILANGRPSTGQHLQPLLAYHWLSHYFDAAIVRVFALDAWDSYALLYYLKATAITIAFIRLIARSTSNWPLSVFWIALIATFPAFTASWYPTASHSQWIPVLLLLLTGPWIADIIRNHDTSAWQWMQLSLLVVILTLGKGSIGLALVMLVATSIVLTGRLGARSAFVLASWGFGLLWWARRSGAVEGTMGLGFSPQGLGDIVAFSVKRLEESSALIFALLGVVVLLLALRKVVPGALPLALGIGISTAVFGIIGVVGPAASSYTFYYFLGLAYVTLVVVLPVALDRPGRREGPSAGVIAVILSLALSPWTATAQFTPYQSLSAMETTLVSLNDVTYRFYNVGRPQEEWITVRRLVSGQVDRTAARERRPTFFEDFRSALDSTLLEIGESRASALLFIPAEIFAEPAFPSPEARGWSSGLLVTATTGMILVHGVHPEAPSSHYGFGAYASTVEDARWRSRDEIVLSELCAYEKPVLILRDSMQFLIETACLPDAVN